MATPVAHRTASWFQVPFRALWRRPVIFIFLIAFAVRAVLIPKAGIGEVVLVESVRIGLTLVREGFYGNAYGADVGPTAHCMPLHPLITAALISVFGLGTAGAVALGVAGSLAASLGFALLPRVSAVCGLGLAPGILAGLTGALLPVNFGAQVTGLYDAPFTLFGSVLLFLVAAQIWMRRTLTSRASLQLGVTAGVLCLLNPALLPVLLAWTVLGLHRFRSSLPAYLLFVLRAGIVLLLILMPWAIRNWNTFHRVIWTRSNLGLELQVSNHDQATPELRRNVETAAWSNLHPYNSAAERERVRRLGEIAYMQEKLREASDWIISHPGPFARLTAQRFLFFWAPPMTPWWRTLLEALISFGGLAGCLWLIHARHPAAWLFAGLLAGYPAIYYIIQSAPRYRLPVEPFLLLLAAVLVVRIPAIALRVPDQQAASEV